MQPERLDTRPLLQVYAGKAAKVLRSPTLVCHPFASFFNVHHSPRPANANWAREDTLSSPLERGDEETATQLHSSGYECSVFTFPPSPAPHNHGTNARRRRRRQVNDWAQTQEYGCGHSGPV